jgi:hypothetical protein
MRLPVRSNSKVTNAALAATVGFGRKQTLQHLIELSQLAAWRQGVKPDPPGRLAIRIGAGAWIDAN